MSGTLAGVSHAAAAASDVFAGKLRDLFHLLASSPVLQLAVSANGIYFYLPALGGCGC